MYVAAIVITAAAIGWLIHDLWNDYQTAIDDDETVTAARRPAPPPTVRVIPPVHDWKTDRWA